MPTLNKLTKKLARSHYQRFPFYVRRTPFHCNEFPDMWRDECYFTIPFANEKSNLAPPRPCNGAAIPGVSLFSDRENLQSVSKGRSGGGRGDS